MKTAFSLFSIALLAFASAALADPQKPAPAPTSQEASAADLALAKLFSAQKPANRSTTCYERVYEYCQSFCYDLSQTNGCDFFTNQECLCERFPADCPVCY